MTRIGSRILQFISESTTKVTLGTLTKNFYSDQQADLKQLKATVNRLIEEGELRYTYHYGSSFIELSYDKAIAVSNRVVIKPPLCSYRALPDQAVVALQSGVAFGCGAHPTTRLVIQLMESLLFSSGWKRRRRGLRAIDIGTGSGVLAIVAAVMDVGVVYGIDTDPCAIYEARDNVRLNDLEDRITIVDEKLEVLPGSFDLVLANLRVPTLLKMKPILERKASADSLLIFSGIKTEEVSSLCEKYGQAGFFFVKKLSEKGWSALGLTRGPLLGDRCRHIL